MAGGGCFRCLRFLVLRWEYMKSTEPRPGNIQAAEPVEQQLKCPNHDRAFTTTQCLWLFRERDGVWSEHDVSVLSNPSLKLKNLFSMSTLVDPGNHLRMLHNNIALMVRKKELPTDCLSIHCILYNVNVGISLSMWNHVIKLLTGTTVWQNCFARGTFAICLKTNWWINASVQLSSTGVQIKKIARPIWKIAQTRQRCLHVFPTKLDISWAWFCTQDN